MSAPAAVLMAAVFEFSERLVFMTMVNATVAQTIYNIADFRIRSPTGADRLVRGVVRDCRAGRCWRGNTAFQTSESHALIAVDCRRAAIACTAV